jgi:hypothetical protein
MHFWQHEHDLARSPFTSALLAPACLSFSLLVTSLLRVLSFLLVHNMILAKCASRPAGVSAAPCIAAGRQVRLALASRRTAGAQRSSQDSAKRQLGIFEARAVNTDALVSGSPDADNSSAAMSPDYQAPAEEEQGRTGPASTPTTPFLARTDAYEPLGTKTAELGGDSAA